MKRKKAFSLAAVEGGLNTTSSLLLLDVTLEVRGGPLQIEVPEAFGCLIAYVWRGQASFQGKEAQKDRLVRRQEAAIFGASGSRVTVANASNERKLNVILSPLGLPVVLDGEHLE